MPSDNHTVIPENNVMYPIKRHNLAYYRSSNFATALTDRRNKLKNQAHPGYMSAGTPDFYVAGLINACNTIAVTFCQG